MRDDRARQPLTLMVCRGVCVCVCEVFRGAMKRKHKGQEAIDTQKAYVLKQNPISMLVQVLVREHAVQHVS